MRGGRLYDASVSIFYRLFLTHLTVSFFIFLSGPALCLPFTKRRKRDILQAGSTENKRNIKEAFMKVLGILGSPRIGGNSDLLLDRALAGAKEAGANVEKFVLDRMRIAGCKDCQKCNETGVCAIKDDMADIAGRILEAQAVIHACPVYFWTMTAQMKAYLDRWCVFFDADWRWHKSVYPKMRGKRIGLLTVCGDPNPHTGDPIVSVFKNTAEMTKLTWLGAVQAAAAAKGDIAGNKKALQEAFELGKKAATP
jgi:multimeric flavodoxin WrbA